ncbi:MAG: SLC13 family permease [Actinobacteria bacterium]|nr:SLC13 family permease [Actinomycetota bacterium]
MTFDIALTLGIVGGAVVLFALDRFRVDVIALMVLLTVALTGLVTPTEAFAGFSNSAVITVWAVYIVSAGMLLTGVADVLGRALLRVAGDHEIRLVVVIMVVCGLASAFMNNVGATAMLLPVVIEVSRRTVVPISRLLIPLSFASLLGGNMTLIGTPANILGANILEDRGLPGLGFFDFLPMGLIVFAVGVTYMAVLGRRLLPVRQSPEDPDVLARELRDYLTEAEVLDGSALGGKTLAESSLGADYDLTVLAVERDGRPRSVVDRSFRFHVGDVLTLKGHAAGMLRAHEELGLAPRGETGEIPLESEDAEITVVEATLAPTTTMVGRTLQRIRFRETYGFDALAIWRRGEIITRRLRSMPLQFGDALLLRGPRHRVATLRDSDEFLLLEPVERATRRPTKAPIAVLTLLGVVLLVSLGGMAIATAMVLGAVVMVVTGCLTMEEAYANIDWRTVFLVAGMLPLGTAMENTGAARYLADLLLDVMGGMGPLGVLAGVYLLSALVTQPMSNAAAVVLIVPIAIDAALGLGANVQPFVLASVIGASTSFLTPVGHKANVLVFGPGGYKFFDYTRAGAPLTLLIFVTMMLTLPVIWPL